MPRETITREQWEEWQTKLIAWYKTRTADSIAEQLRNDHGFNVTAKMLRDRFKAWNAQPKYHKRQIAQPRRRRREPRALADDQALQFSVVVDIPLRMQQEVRDGNNGEIETYVQHYDGVMDQFCGTGVIENVPVTQMPLIPNDERCLTLTTPSRTPNTPEEDCHLQWTLKEVTGYLDRIVEHHSWTIGNEAPAFELQKLTANMHMAISSQKYDSHHIWRELGELVNPVSKIMPRLNETGLLTMHPRALTVLLRLLVDSISFDPSGSKTLLNVQSMFCMVTRFILLENHPIRLMCEMPKAKATELLYRLLELMDVRLYSRISNEHARGRIFVAREQTYAARVLASLGYTNWAHRKLASVISELDDSVDTFTKADALRTDGYVLEQAGSAICTDAKTSMFQDSKASSTSALDLFIGMGEAHSNEAMFTRISLAQVSRKLGELSPAEMHLTEAIDIWQKTRRSEDQGGSKVILDLHQVLIEQSKHEEARELRQLHQRYFEESRVYYEDEGS